MKKSITDEEIRTHQKFFENCAKDYRNLAKKLILELVRIKKIKLDEDFPFLTFNRIKGSSRHNKGRIKEWKYFFHGYHCYFFNIETKLQIEIPYMFGMEFGDLDPYFFSIFIKTNPNYQPLPFSIENNFEDGQRILKVMLELGLYEKIHSNLLGHSGIAVKDRDKVEIKIFDAEKYNHQLKSKFIILKWLGIR